MAGFLLSPLFNNFLIAIFTKGCKTPIARAPIATFGRTAKVVAYPNASGDVIIPDTIVYNSQNLKVIEIGANAFERNEKT